jgi:putative phage-type endonuclease
MKTLNLIQGSDDWLAYRKQMVTASEMASVMNKSPYKSALQLYNSKVNSELEQTSFQMLRGQTLEPVARRMFEQITDTMYPAEVVVSDEHPFLMASLDGLNAHRNEIIEIKYQGKDNHLALLTSKFIPEHYMIQVQTQLLVTGCARCAFISYNPDVDSEPFLFHWVLPDTEMQAEILNAAINFKEYLDKKITPPTSELDAYDIDKDKELKSLMSEYAEMDKQIKQLEERKESFRRELIKHLDSHDIKFAKSKLGTVRYIEKTGNINYKSIPELKGLDLEKYRNKASNYWSITIKAEG